LEEFSLEPGSPAAVGRALNIRRETGAEDQAKTLYTARLSNGKLFLQGNLPK
jgi:hypothetical protein